MPDLVYKAHGLNVAHMTVSELVDDLQSNIEGGLSEADVSARTAQFGPNELPEPEGTSFWSLVLEQFNDRMVWLLLFSAVISIVLAFFEGDEGFSWTSLTEPIVILLILIANAIIGVTQDLNAEMAVLSLRSFENPTSKVLRGERYVVLNSAALVPGDVVLLKSGDIVPADCRLVSLQHCDEIYVDETILTGETTAVPKDCSPIPFVDGVDLSIHEQSCVVFSGTTITGGHCKALVFGTGLDRQVGRLQASATEVDNQPSPLKQQLNKFGEQLWWAIVIICVLVWVINIPNFRNPDYGGWTAGCIYYFKTAIALAVAAIPEGLPAVMTICLSLGTKRMAKRGVIVRRLNAVETLGSVSVVGTDKTGTLTTNRMAVTHISLAPHLKRVPVTQYGFLPSSDCLNEADAKSAPAQAIGAIGCLCTDSLLSTSTQVDSGMDSVVPFGDPTECALLTLTEKIGFNTDGSRRIITDLSPNRLQFQPSDISVVRNSWSNHFPIIRLNAFTRSRRLMSAICRMGDIYVTLVKGSPETVLAQCTHQMSSMNPCSADAVFVSDTSRLSESDRDAALNQAATMASSGFRVLAMAYKTEQTDIVDIASAESDLVFVGLVAMHDPPRQDVLEALEKCQSAGIQVMMITGDHQSTALSIGREIGLINPTDADSDVLATGADWKRLHIDQRQFAVQKLKIFARTEPIQKQEIVESLQEKHERVVAMTGDGVNDIPALALSDVGVAMGDGSDLTRSSADLVLLDSSFATLVSAVEEGRLIYENCVEFLKFLISSNFGEVFCIFLSTILNLPQFLSPVQLLWINLVTDGLPATALSFNKADGDLMSRRPRKRTSKLVDGFMLFRFLVVGLYIGFACVGAYMWYFLYADDGPQLTYEAFRMFCRFMMADTAGREALSEFAFNDWEFHLTKASTHALSVLVVIEMVNAFNCMSLKESIFTHGPHTNMLLVYATSLSIFEHWIILVIPFMRNIFGITTFGLYDWIMCFIFCLPVLLCEEILKWYLRRKESYVSTSGVIRAARRGQKERLD